MDIRTQRERISTSQQGGLTPLTVQELESLLLRIKYKQDNISGDANQAPLPHVFMECRIKLACLIFQVPSTVQIYNFTTSLLFIIHITVLESHLCLAMQTAPRSTKADNRIHGGPAGTQVNLQAHTPAGRAGIP